MLDVLSRIGHISDSGKGLQLSEKALVPVLQQDHTKRLSILCIVGYEFDLFYLQDLQPLMACIVGLIYKTKMFKIFLVGDRDSSIHEYSFHSWIAYLDSKGSPRQFML